MANTIRIKRRSSAGAAGAPLSLQNAELAYNEADDTLYYGKGTGGEGGTSTTVEAIAGSGSYVTKGTTQTISGNKTFSGTLSIEAPSSNSHATTKLYVDNAVAGVAPSGTANQISVTSGVISLASSVTTPGDLTVTGNLTVNGTTTTVNSTTVTVDDKNLELASVASPSDTSADGAGITIKGTTDKTWNWVDSTDAWTSSEHINMASGKSYHINGVSVLSGSTLGSGVTSSSLTSVGTIATGTWQGSAVAVSYGGTGATSASSARSNLGLAIGTDVQAYSATLAAVVAGAYTGATSITTVGTITTGTWSATIDNVTIDGGTF